MTKKLYIIPTVIIALLLTACGIYTFSGSTLPSDLKTVDVPLFLNQSLEPTVADDLTQELNREVLSGNLLRVVSSNGDATISGTVTSYSNSPYTFGAAEVRQVNVTQYIVRISADVNFFDNKKDKALYKGTVTGEGIYNFQTQTEQDGKQIAIKQIVQHIMQNSLQSW